LTDQHSRGPAATGHSGFDATDFVDTVPVTRDEGAPTLVPAIREPIDRANARHEGATAGLPAAIGAIRQASPQRTRASPPATSVQGVTRSNVMPFPARARSHSDASASTRQPLLQADAVSTAQTMASVLQASENSGGTHSAGRLRNTSAIERRSTCTDATPAQVSPGTSSGADYSDRTAPRRPSPARVPPRHREARSLESIPDRRKVRASSVAVLAAVAWGAFMIGARQGTDNRLTPVSSAASLPRPSARMPAGVSPAPAAPARMPDSEAMQLATTARIESVPAYDQLHAVSTRSPRAPIVALRMETDLRAMSPAPLRGQDAAASDIAAAAVEAKAKADALPRNGRPFSTEPEFAKSIQANEQQWRHGLAPETAPGSP